MSRPDASAVADNTVPFHCFHRTNPVHITYQVYSEKLRTEQNMDPGPDFNPGGGWYELSSLCLRIKDELSPLLLLKLPSGNAERRLASMFAI